MFWRDMREHDLGAVKAVADRIHVEHVEDAAVFAERLRLHPNGCRVLADGRDIAGYAIAHPWYLKHPPKLNALLRAIPEIATTYYVHDVALLPRARGAGHASAILREMEARARALRLPNLSLVALSGTEAFWARQGFRIIEDAEIAARLASYGAARLMARDLTGR